MSRVLSLVIGNWKLGIAIALFARLALIPNPGFEADMSFWKGWGLSVVDFGIVEGLKISNNNYPTPFSYVLGAMVWVYKLFADPHNFNEFWTNTNLLFLTIAKSIPILADFGIAAIILWFVSKFSILDKHVLDKYTNFKMFPFGYILALMYLFSPISLIDGAWWGQVDSLGVFIFLVAFVCALKRRPFLAGAVYMAAVMTKLQNMIYGPVFFLFIWQTLGYRGFMRALAGSTLAFFGLNIEFFLSRNMDRVFASLTENYDYFPLMSLNAYNLWWIVSGAKGMQVSDKFLAVGIMNAKTVGLLLFSSVYLFAVLRQIFIRPGLARQGLAFGNFLESLILINAAFFLFQTQSHDRYAFPLLVFLLLWAPYLIRKKVNGKWQKEESEIDTRAVHFFTFSFFLFTFFYSYNLHTALVVNYPNNGLPLVSDLTQPFFTITTSVVLLGLFVVFFLYLVKHTKSIVSVVAVAVPITILFLGNLPLITKKPVSLTRFTPYIAEQGYGKRTINMPVSAFLGFSKQSFLSVQYAFYRTGLGTHSPSYIVYDLGGHFRKFTTDYGIDTQAGGKGSAVFEVYGDDKLLFRSDKIGRYDLPRHADVDVTSVKKLGLVTTDAGDGKDDDHTDWLHPQLWP